MMEKDWLRAFDCDYVDFYRFRTIEETKKYAEVIAEAVQEFIQMTENAKVVYVDAFRFSLSLDYEDYAADGLHLSSKGNQTFSQYLLNYI